MSGTSEGICSIKCAGGRSYHCDFAGATLPHRGKDQDRFGMQFSANGLAVGIFDGHSLSHNIKQGIQHAENACAHLIADVWSRAKAPLAALGSDGALTPEVTRAVEASYTAHQERMMRRYQREVADAMLAEKLRIEKEAGLEEGELPFELPQEGGTTATLLVLHEGGVLASWVGDSRAVAGVQEEGGELRAEALTVDHNVHDAAELARIQQAGGSTAAAKGEDAGKLAEMVCVGGVEGTLKVTRSLGDSPFHKDDIVSHVPGLTHRPLSPSLRFVVACSDGVWDLLDDAAVVKLVGEHVASYTGGAMQNAASGACAAIVKEVQAKSPTAGEPDDDVSVVVVVLKAVAAR